MKIMFAFLFQFLSEEEAEEFERGKRGALVTIA
jgi:hypothetical protein